MKYSIYHLQTGQIIRAVTCTASDLAMQFDPAHHAAIEGDFPDDRFYVDSGEFAAMPPRPSQHHAFDWAAKAWVDPRTLADLRAAKWAEIKRARSVAEYGGFTWDGSAFDSDAISQARIQGAVQLAGMSEGFSIDWTLANNAVRTLSAADMLAVGAALGMHVAAQFSRARTLRQMIENATELQLEQVSWEAP